MRTYAGSEPPQRHLSQASWSTVWDKAEKTRERPGQRRLRPHEYASTSMYALNITAPNTQSKGERDQHMLADVWL